jgi:ribonuclease HII
VKEDFDILAAFPGLNDSKKLTEKKREKLFELLLERVACGDASYHVELIGHDVIDLIGIVPAVVRGVEQGIGNLLPEPAQGKVWLDGSLKAPRKYEQETVIGGDALIPAIMLASIAAKVTRDRHMVNLADKYPLYGFEKHKGYGTSAHYEALRTHGLCDLHRRTFIHI